MMTVITETTLQTGSEPEWDEAMRDRLAAATGQPGWMGGQMLIPLEGLNRRVIVGTWKTRADWEAWHNDPAFLDTRKRLEGLQEGPDEMRWFEVVVDGEEPAGA